MDSLQTKLDVRVNHSSLNFYSSFILSSKLTQYKSKFESTISSTCESIGSDITSQTQAFIVHVNTLKYRLDLEITQLSLCLRS